MWPSQSPEVTAGVPVFSREPLAEEVNERTSDLSALGMALLTEKDSVPFYSKAALETQNPEGRSMYERLVEIEREHNVSWTKSTKPWPSSSGAPRVGSLGTARPRRLFNALADETRLKIIRLLSEGENSVNELVEVPGIAQSTASHHLWVLNEAGFIQGGERGRNAYDSFAPASGDRESR